MDRKQIRFLSLMGARGSLGQAVYDYLESNNDCFIVSADLMHASGFDRIMQKYHEKCINVGIAEQNLIGVSAGLSRSGLPVIATTWAMFASIRALDQVRNFMGFMQSNVKLIGMDSGFAKSNFGYSHSNPPDISAMRSIPGITIVSPCDCLQVYQSVISSLKKQGPIYIRLPGGPLPIIFDENYNFEIGKATVIEEGDDIAIIATGASVKNAIEVMKLLKNDGIFAKVIDMSTIKPLDTKMLDRINHYSTIITIEDHLISGGLGNAISEYYSEKKDKPKIIIFGVNDCYPPSGTREYIEDLCGLSPQKITQKILSIIKNNDLF